MKYEKPPLAYPQQADLLVERGLIADRDTLIKRLKAVSYYRLNGYWFPFQNEDDSFKPGANLDTVWNRYTFDRRLRLLVMDAIERVEVSIRTSLIYHHSLACGPFGYADPENLPHLKEEERDKFLGKLKYETKRSSEVFVKRFKRKYGDSHEVLPIWAAAEIMSFGTLLSLFRGVQTSIKKEIAKELSLPDAVILSWLRTLNGVRNVCAHHSRLWNREFGDKPKIPGRRKNPEWHEPVEVHNNRIFGILTILKYLMDRIAPQSKWPERFDHLLAEYPEIPIRPMGFPENWRECEVWG